MDFIMRFLSSYSESFAAALLLWPLASFALTLPILAYLYHRDGRIRFLSAAGTYVAVLYLLGLACFTLYPLPAGDSGPGITYGLDPILNPLHFIDDFRKDGIVVIAQLFANMALFVPLGFIAGRGLRLGVVPAVIIGFLASLLIETAQLTGLFGLYPYAYRTFETTDLVTNTTGALLGWLLARLVGRALPQRAEGEPPVTNQPGFVRRCVALAIDMTIVGAGAVLATSLVTLPFALANLSCAAVAGAPVMALAACALFAVVEVIQPWRRGGQTLGGSFVRMTFETRERAGGRRVAFYVVRAFVILSTTGLFGLWPQVTLVPLVCLVFYLFKRCMPYDLI